jgi:hypothetical protein
MKQNTATVKTTAMKFEAEQQCLTLLVPRADISAQA